MILLTSLIAIIIVCFTMYATVRVFVSTKYPPPSKEELSIIGADDIDTSTLVEGE